MPDKCLTATVIRTVTVAAGSLAPGHLGELTRHVPFELVDAVVEETNTSCRRRRHLPSRVGVYFLLALTLFCGLGYQRVWEKLCAGLAGLPLHHPSEKALRDLRRRLGTAPIKALFEAVAGPLARPAVPGVCYRHWRTVAFDGCSSIRAADRPRVLERLRKPRGRWGEAGHPTLQLMPLVETGTRGLLGAVFGSTATGELTYAQRLLHLLTHEMPPSLGVTVWREASRDHFVQLSSSVIDSIVCNTCGARAASGRSWFVSPREPRTSSLVSAA